MIKSIELQRVVVTGMGAISPVGNDLDEFWQNLVDGKSGIDLITKFDAADFETKFAGEVKNFEPEQYIDRKEARRMDLFTQYAIAASEMAVKQSGLNFDSEDRDRVGVIVSSGIGGMETFEKQSRTLIERGPSRISPFFIPMLISDIAPGYISIRYGLRGPNFSTVSACASSSHAIGEAYRHIQRGDADIMICGGAEATITPLGVGGFNAMKALSTRNDAPQKASRPFDKRRDGFVMGDGAGIVVLESLPHALNRGATILAELAGMGYTADAYHITAPAPNGEGATVAMQKALRDAGMQFDEIDYINTHGTSTPHGDKAETIAIKKVFGEHAYQLNINSTKSMIGHLLGASGGIEFIVTTMSVQKDLIHPTINQQEPDPECDLNCTPNEAKQKVVRAAISNSFGFGGHNVSIVVKKFEE
ncbi:beta-ketoacyl-ACP synthase II [candidate division KSB1 bacterium]|nr:beta-ketoacyl-ACP synthase II [candidate division KSB1 bacterium]NIR71857.1 beta-ketoacyl-ACP synthase II [candidate division KSB1 bacterium]NIS25373.1 beta-ketoacyl-ACP synthase II [candidate division KSB1 bacterium]NIT71843.1 beta-ketoacyl-ACP synthase II [candidate division KSB1 bacterium]NIU25581.1 beta-ketoacyl-ACP synthase II [candidate division KSB1 bacterium]